MTALKFILPFLCLLMCSCAEKHTVKSDTAQAKRNVQKDSLVRMSGVSLEMPANEIAENKFGEVADFGAKWVALIPYGYTQQGESKVHFNWEGRWWGESLNGTARCITYAHDQGLKTLLKPHVWVVGQGWPGRFEPESESKWLEWEKSYRDYILACAYLADSLDVDAFCIGTEYRKAVVDRPQFWSDLIDDVREVYQGPLTYAANWDNYENVSFWDKLDFIGIDAYFPLSKKKEPTTQELEKGWEEIAQKLDDFAQKWNKKIAFTEYGFKSVDYLHDQSSKEGQDVKPNMQNQKNAYTAFFNSVWRKDWMMGGFFWKWHFYENAGGKNNTRYTPQNKPAAAIVQRNYKSTKSPK
ncbi:MAG: glycoside hydrolase TIM-barrel-like domain-containing protein [Flavobacteriales bacterium]|nr:glycoside hydrolase TIM-barrel-like domain-containing protein [Flavobacteriales bacterium]